jgi:hypothetical protein
MHTAHMIFQRRWDEKNFRHAKCALKRGETPLGQLAAAKPSSAMIWFSSYLLSCMLILHWHDTVSLQLHSIGDLFCLPRKLQKEWRRSWVTRGVLPRILAFSTFLAL